MFQRNSKRLSCVYLYGDQCTKRSQFTPSHDLQMYKCIARGCEQTVTRVHNCDHNCDSCSQAAGQAHGCLGKSVESNVCCLCSPQTRLSQIPDLCPLLTVQSLGHTPALYSQPIRVPDSVTFGCPAPRLGLPLLRSAACFPRRSLCLALFWCAGETEVQFLELLNPYV